MSDAGSVTRFVLNLHCQDPALREEAARQICLRFSDRLAREVKRQLDPRLLRKAGVDDVMQSLFASFFAATPGPNGPPASRADLWRLLVHFTMCKVANTADYHKAQKRDYHREVQFPEIQASPADYRGIDPADELVAKLEFERLHTLLPSDLQHVFQLRLDGFSNSEIARAIGRVERTVDLKLRTIRKVLGPHPDEIAVKAKHAANPSSPANV